MPIQIKLKQLLKDRNISSKELAQQIGITEANLSILVSGKAKAIRFSTLESICQILQCDINDVMSFVESHIE